MSGDGKQAQKKTLKEMLSNGWLFGHMCKWIVLLWAFPSATFLIAMFIFREWSAPFRFVFEDQRVIE